MSSSIGHRIPALSLRRLSTSLAIAATIVSQLPMTAASAAVTPVAPARTAGDITFAATVPVVQQRLPLFRLSQVLAPTALVQSVLAATKAAPLAMSGQRMLAQNARGSLSAYVDGVTGDAEVFPDLNAAPAASPILTKSALERAATNVFARPDMIPKDETVAQLGNETPIFGTSHVAGDKIKNAAGAATRHMFTYVNAVRYAAGLPVVGKGSQASVAVADDGSIRGMVHRWRAAHAAGTITPTLSAAQVAAAIAAQLKPFTNAHTQVTVNRITRAYYDGGAAYLQPVYTFFATIHGGRVSDDHVAGYVPMGKLVEPLPVLGATPGPAPSTLSAAAAGRRVAPDANGAWLTLGEYANDDGTMIDMANAYNNGYTANSPWWAPGITRSQWYWAQPYDYVGSSNDFVNSVDIAYTNPHGDWWENTTNGNGAGFFYISQIGTNGSPGYGAAAGGRLSTWIIDSCEVIPSAYDLSVTTGDGNNAFWPWFPVFQGLHRALGFRTQMLLGMDDMNWHIAYDQAQGADAVSAFFNDVNAANFSQYGTYYNGHLGRNVLYDRVSVMVDDRNNGESIYGTAAQSAAGRIDNYWMGD